MVLGSIQVNGHEDEKESTYKIRSLLREQEKSHTKKTKEHNLKVCSVQLLAIIRTPVIIRKMMLIMVRIMMVIMGIIRY